MVTKSDMFYFVGVTFSVKLRHVYRKYDALGLAWFPRSRLATLFFSKISMCSYEKAGWPGYRDLSVCDRDLSNRAGNFSHMNTPTLTEHDL